ncbi:hypothetical protein IQ257_02590 [Coleofasciculus sp. LEGE 07092]|nr:hypothetical protein [Coleofasciculus sp. LEGE 07081]MBE9125363.1 hypothetical protein [Coleofasciculus sp. LEGE 07081]MBE9147420.1 hypothetical protein [Coleofasciculus sp. LEGE 07092]
MPIQKYPWNLLGVRYTYGLEPGLEHGSWYGSIKLWQLSTGKEICTLKEHVAVVNSLVFSPDGKTLVSCSSDKTIKIWQRD